MPGTKIVIILLIIYICCCACGKEGLASRPTEEESKRMAGEAVRNRALFNGKTTLREARESLPWLDAVVYEDLQKAGQQDALTVARARQIISG